MKLFDIGPDWHIFRLPLLLLGFVFGGLIRMFSMRRETVYTYL